MEEEQGEDSEVLDAMDGWDSEEETNANSAAPGTASADGGDAANNDGDAAKGD
jgi:hypothetical protein